MERGEYTERLRALLNEGAEYGLEEISLDGTDTVNLNKLIDEAYPMAWAEIPVWDKEGVMVSDVTPTALDECGPNSQVGYIDLPSDYHSFVSLKMEGWRIPVTTLVTRESSVGRMQGFLFGRGNPSRPVGVLEYAEDAGKWRIYYYSIAPNREHKLQSLRIIKKPSIYKIDVREESIKTLLLWHAVYIGTILNRADMVKYYTELLTRN